MLNKPVRPTRFYSTKQEKRVAKDLEGKRTANSGATPWQKGDVYTDKFLIECKTAMTEKQTFKKKKKWLKALPEEAFSAGKDYWALAFDFGDGDEYYIIDKKTFKQFKSTVEREEQNNGKEETEEKSDDCN